MPELCNLRFKHEWLTILSIFEKNKDNITINSLQRNKIFEIEEFLKFAHEMCFTKYISFTIFGALTPNCPRPQFCLFMKFGQAIVIRVLMLKF